MVDPLPAAQAVLLLPTLPRGRPGGQGRRTLTAGLEVASRRDLPARIRARTGVRPTSEGSGPYLHIRKGQITGEEAVLQSGIVARAGQVP